ncbi:MAG: hypothetical protein ACREP6_14955 [Candidatus Binataceae bacterium]
MIVISRKLKKIIPYKTIFFPDEERLGPITSALRPIEMARLFYTPVSGENVRRLVSHQPTPTILNDLLLSRDELMKRCAKYTRHEIQLAQKLGERVRIERNGENASQLFLEVYNDFARSKDGVWPVSEAVIRNYAPYADIVVVHLDEQPAVVNLLLRDREAARVRGMLTASRRLSVDDKKAYRLLGNVNRLMHWGNMCFYKDSGFEIYDWGGISGDKDDGIAKFKLSFGGEIVRENTYLCAGSPRFGKLILTLFENLSKRGRYGRAAAESRASKLKAA